MDASLVDFMGIAETKLHDTFPDTQLKIENYKMYRKDVNSQSQGIMAYIRSDIPHSRRKDLKGDHDDVQILTYEVVLKKEKWIVVFMYKPPPIRLHIHTSHYKVM